MKRPFKSWSRIYYLAAIALAAITAISPSSTAVLCISPGNHIAIEDINSGCCESGRNHLAMAQQEPGQFESADDCGHCTDLFIASYGREAIAQSQCGPAGMAQSDECFGNDLPANAAFRSLFLQDAITKIDVQELVSSSAPLRC